MKRWILLAILVLFLGGSVTLYWFYQDIRAIPSNTEEQMEQFVAEEALLDEIQSVSTYNGSERVHHVEGMHGDAVYHLLLDEDFELLHEFAEDDILAKEEAEALVMEGEEGLTLRSNQLGYKNGAVAYEITYLLPDGRYGYDYIHAENGSLLQRYRLRGDT
ncbi:hypothetical protein [Salsuginibacillus kocurii]|uniref:hypothetical protein n=1 Tax=Salsuginibacillus kocurii TaxID=427078 RepID=UPI0003733FA8|nr:hypothetical protein [Salsuginibacillus kocurii]